MVEVKILSGGLSTELEAAGFLLQGDPLWSARLLHTNPQAIKNVHTSFLSSGADVLSTATYQASIEGFKDHLELNVEEAAKLIHVGVQIAKEAADEYNMQSPVKKEIIIAGSIGPYGAFLHDGSEYTGSYVSNMSTEELKDWHRAQMQCLVSSGVDMLALETIPSQKEAEALVQLLREFPNMKAWLSFSCQSITSTAYGDIFGDAVRVAMGSNQLVAIGVNCCSPAFVGPLLASANKNNDLDIKWIAYPNSGEEWDHSLGWKGCNTKMPLTEHAVEWVQLGARWIGGCCRTSPSDIANLEKVLRPKPGHIDQTNDL
ncbi:uncharacterized protein LOC128654113 [Bombina bombina]|uniref:uncharacterized protein LOC128654113 n=1 Tax=Bombina bombina TaxID=8345 RepID=UPI00235AE2CF|nr:uncharacterized protein LOC128654113 [Bombina bombina]XP_053563774.1 uncharacterized protein LOC128654113 [Bombina bombina]XP_053563775.1 uncharacterized protein LOC128654113 [Bombina bombina]XP_053563776.1 uncharacterized protein LOC128654113 [Bombina bombina]